MVFLTNNEKKLFLQMQCVSRTTRKWQLCETASPFESMICFLSCPPGFMGDFCEVDVNECCSAPCHNGAICQDLINSYVCHCRSGESLRHPASFSIYFEMRQPKHFLFLYKACYRKALWLMNRITKTHSRRKDTIEVNKSTSLCPRCQFTICKAC